MRNGKAACYPKDAAQAGVDGIVAQGWEAGGHVRGQVSTMALVPAAGWCGSRP
jgi:NAD(P)H-dependent flavin oxidoreductase YrpB (nitropropane dioxygenase family)